MPSYDYKCSSCDYTYNEVRRPIDDAFFTKCASCGADYVLVNQTPIPEDTDPEMLAMYESINNPYIPTPEEMATATPSVTVAETPEA